eukprot:CAMPEP_0182862034 /NCGR_PEP_ID=MMETSP0034_2-20130328/5831_1 /TAXON_ID=156128 /ORGANISM="Nephroselmis pyriformis, Strain CCMP717" /LENGTH=370 /DNA_ID=CAMNT_0024994037 /DNA_START=113 /DNA_END=1226 /DNA_ORIENTATION=+
MAASGTLGSLLGHMGHRTCSGTTDQRGKAARASARALEGVGMRLRAGRAAGRVLLTRKALEGAGGRRAERWVVQARAHRANKIDQASDVAATSFLPTRIILVRHGESEGNVDESAYQRKPDHAIHLTLKGRQQAREAGKAIHKLINDPNESVYFYVSPYQRAMETCWEIGQAFDEDRILGVREEPRMREQDFGNFQDASMEDMKKHRQRFGRFFFRFRDGESAADVYDRVTTFRETMRTDMERGRFDEAGFSGCTGHHLHPRGHAPGLPHAVVQVDGAAVRADPQLEELRADRDDPRGGGALLALPHHTEADLLKSGFSQEMIEDQRWQALAETSDLNPDWATSGPSFFKSFVPTDLREQGDGLAAAARN